MNNIDKDILQTDSCDDHKKRQITTKRVVNLGLTANAILAVAKLTTGILGHSQALLADGINSFSDVVYFIIVRILVSLSGRPADEEHPYGHHQFESIAAVVVGAFVITTGLTIFWDSVNSAYGLFSGETEESLISRFALLVVVVTIVIKIVLMINARITGNRIQSIAILALASDHRNDIFASTGAGIGIFFGILGYKIFDPLAGAIVAVIVVKTGVEILRESANELMDSVPSKKIDLQIRNLIKTINGVKTIESVHAHRFGPYYIANITIGIDGKQTVDKGNEIADHIEEYLYDKIDMLKKVYIHYHPANADATLEADAETVRAVADLVRIVLDDK